jgi:hypothetical protein
LETSALGKDHHKSNLIAIKMKHVSELKQGDKIYDIDSWQIKWYKYLCVHPTGQGKYHILIGPNQDPVRISGATLQAILNRNLQTCQEAEIALADRLEKYAKQLRNRAK